MSWNVVALLQDVLVNAMPAVLLWNLQMPRRQKITAWALLAAGSFATVAGVVRVYYTTTIYFEDDLISE